MEAIHQIVIDNYSNIHPLRLYIGFFLLLVALGLLLMFIIKDIFDIDWSHINKKNTSANQKQTKIDNSKSDLLESVIVNISLDGEYFLIDKNNGFYIEEESTKKTQSLTTLSHLQIEQNSAVKENLYTLSEESINRIEPQNKENTKTKLKDEIPKEKLEVDKQQNEIIKVKYTSSKIEQTDLYPIFRYPKQGTVIRSYRFGSTKRRGYKEDDFQRAIDKAFCNDFIISGDLRINTGKDTRPFEPDIAMIDKSNNCVRIDIEIDEPYAGITRQPIHCIGDDRMRDMYFVDRGWIVIRFSEHQVHLYEKQCLRFISDVIQAVSPSFSIPPSLLNYKIVENEKTWDTAQAQKWEKEKYRETYLNHEFTQTEEIPETTARGLNRQEQEEEKLVTQTSIGIVEKCPSIGFNLINAHSRDQRIQFYPESHIYTIDNIPAPSVSTIISRFFPEFDYYEKANMLSTNNPLYGLPVEEIINNWNSRRIEAANKGTLLHEQIEKYYLGESYTQTDEFHLFEKFAADNKDLKPYRSEWKIFDEHYHIAGRIDMIVKNGIEYDIYDWKRSKKVIDTSSENPITTTAWGNVGIGKLSNIDDTSYNKYCLQQSIYRYILEKNYNLKISRMYLVVLHPKYNKYYKVDVPYQKDNAEYILRTL